METMIYQDVNTNAEVPNRGLRLARGLARLAFSVMSRHQIIDRSEVYLYIVAFETCERVGR